MREREREKDRTERPENKEGKREERESIQCTVMRHTYIQMSVSVCVNL